MNTIPHFVNGQRVEVSSDRHLSVFNPATAEAIGTLSVPSTSFLDEVVATTVAAAAQWRASSLSRRTAVLFAFRELLVRHTDELALLITTEQGKTSADARGELARGLENVEYACGLADHLKGEFASQVADGVDVHSFREPIGVVLAITPFNFPAMVPLWMLANAIAAGNGVVLKPSERDPSAAVRLAELLIEAGLPAGVLNVVHGDRQTVEYLLEHPSLEAISFVGSTPVAQSIYATGTRLGKRVQALGGAKNHMVVLPDADIEVAADAAINAGFGAAGERCMAISVVVAVGDSADKLVDAIATRMDRLTVGSGVDSTSDMGPLITQEHRDRVAHYVTNAPSEGAVIVRSGADLIGRPGFYFGPSLLDHVTTDMACYRDEIFGPVLSVVRVENFDDAVALVNANPFGNGVAIFTRDGNAARLFSRAVSVGMIGINVPLPVPVASFSFGGWKNSLFGHAHMYGPEGMAFYTRGKVVTSRWPEPNESQIDLGFPRTR
jgi:malonate-semialdehyde dehydrogenase (acetylating)/methylmalonate-semialdehyde dehydrogenase